MNENDPKKSTSPVRRFLRIVLWVGIGALSVGLFVIGLLTVILVGMLALRQATLYEAILIVLSAIILVVGYWGLVWWAENNGIARWHEDEIEVVESELDEWDDGKSQ